MPQEGSRRLRIHVLYTTPAQTKTALQHAAKLSEGLDAEIDLVLTPIVPFPLPVDRPPASLEFAQEEIRRLAELLDLDLRGYIYLCRDPLTMLESVLRPHSLLVMGFDKRLFFNRAARLARALRRRGHHVVTRIY